VISVENLSMCYPGGIRALHATSVRFSPREFTVLLGPSGAGKSTLLRCLNLLLAPTEGKIFSTTAGELKSPRAIRAHRLKTAMIFQQHQLIGRYTALDNVLIGRMGYHGAWRGLFPLPRKDRLLALECLERVGLLDKALTRADRLSGGEQQRVGIARALAQRPETILADEPVASLDPATANHVLSLLRTICADEGLTAIVSLHQLQLAKRYADRVIGMSQGRAVFDGAAEELTEGALRRIYSTAKRETERAAAGDGQGGQDFALADLSPLQP